MNSAWLDIVVRTLLGSTLVMAQAIMLNWLRVPFAAITLFAGIAAYATVAGVTPVIVILFVVTVGFLVLVRPLPRDRYLLLSLASLALARSIAGSLRGYGGELGMATSTTWIAAQVPKSAMPYAIALFLSAFLVLLLLRHSEMGLAVDVARAAGTEMHAASMSPTGILTAIMLALVAVLASLTGAVQGAYPLRLPSQIAQGFVLRAFHFEIHASNPFIGNRSTRCYRCASSCIGCGELPFQCLTVCDIIVPGA